MEFLIGVFPEFTRTELASLLGVESAPDEAAMDVEACVEVVLGVLGERDEADDSESWSVSTVSSASVDKEDEDEAMGAMATLAAVFPGLRRSAIAATLGLCANDVTRAAEQLAVHGDGAAA
ncbi:hypothetical protein HK100_008200, partial [Physocladia obscura]